MKLLSNPRLGFYDLEKAKKCPLSAFGSFLGLGKTLPRELPTRPILVGLFFHALMEKDTSNFEGNDDYDFCVDEVRKLELSVLDNPRLKWMGSPRTWKEVNAAANAFLLRGVQRGGESSSKRVTDKLISNSGILVGRPDLLRLNDGEAELWEFKSAHIYAEGTTVAKHVRQILYYSYLIFQNFDVERVNARIIGLAGHESSREILKGEADLVGSESEALVQNISSKINEISSLEELAEPGAPQCLECSIRSECPSFLKTQYTDEAFNSVRVIKGLLKTVTTKGSDVVLDIDGTAVVIRPIIGIPVSEVEPFIGQEITVTYCRTSFGQAELTYRSQIVRATEAIDG